MFKTTLTGNICNDAEVTAFDNGSKVVSFSVAHSKKWNDKNGVKQEKTTWVRCNMWKQENLAQYLKKGVRVLVEGEIEARAYTNKEGQTVASLELTVFAIEMQGSGSGNSNENTAPAVSTPPQNVSTPPTAVSTPPTAVSNTPTNEEDDNLPF